MIQKDFIWSEDQEPHHQRRLEILRSHPEVKKLFGVDTTMAYKALFVCALQLAVPLFFLSDNPWIFVATAVFVGTTLNHILVLAIHEITHDLVFKEKWMNNLLAMIVNFPLLFPFAMSFKTYHAEHHWHQGHDKIDVDIASRNEVKIFKGFFGKLIWMFFQIPFYSLRPLFIYPIKPDKWIYINIVIQLSFFVGFYFIVGWWGLFYLFISLALAGGLHPLGGHFVSEHVVFKEGQETYSYYGPLNRVVFNVGYHNEHHDFPNIPGSRLPELKKVVGQSYDNLYSYNSWVKVIVSFLTNKNVGLYSRVKRQNPNK
jgi:sphingolipid 4-desaturase/C4-monooxygenase